MAGPSGECPIFVPRPSPHTPAANQRPRSAQRRARRIRLSASNETPQIRIHKDGQVAPFCSSIVLDILDWLMSVWTSDESGRSSKMLVILVREALISALSAYLYPLGGTQTRNPGAAFLISGMLPSAQKSPCHAPSRFCNRIELVPHENAAPNATPPLANRQGPFKKMLINRSSHALCSG